MGLSVSKGLNGSLNAHPVRPSGTNSSTGFNSDCFRAGILLTAYDTAWYGCDTVSRGQSGYLSSPLAPMYDSDDEPTKPNGVISALTVNSPSPNKRSSFSKSSVPVVANVPIMRSLSDPLQTVVSAVRAQHPRTIVQVKHKHLRSGVQHNVQSKRGQHATVVRTPYRTSKQPCTVADSRAQIAPQHHQHVLQQRGAQHDQRCAAKCGMPWNAEHMGVAEVAV